jgi:hypothetical protein
MRRAAAWIAIAGALVLGGAARAAELRVGGGTSLDLGTTFLDLGCSDLAVDGTMAAGSAGFDQARNVTIGASGVLSGESGTLIVTGDWNNAAGGSFVAGTSTVSLVDGCGVSTSSILGNTTFATLKLMSATGKTYQLEAGSTQTVGVELDIAGVTGNLLDLRSTSAGSEATLDAQGTSSVDFVAVQDIHCSPSPIVFGPNSSLGTNLANASLCGDIDGSLAIDAADVMAAREFLVGKTISGDVTLCNVIGPYDPAESGADCGVEDVFVLERLVAGLPVTAEDGCTP